MYTNAKPLSKVPFVLLAALHLSMLLHTAFYWENRMIHHIPLMFKTIWYILLDIKCFMQGNLEYLLCIFLLSVIKVLLLLRYVSENCNIISILLWNGLLKVLVYGLLIYYYSPIFRRNLYFMYAWDKTVLSFSFEDAFLRAFMEIHIVNISVQKLWCFLHDLESSIAVFTFCNVLKICAEITMYAHAICYKKRSRCVLGVLVAIWTIHMTYSNIRPFYFTRDYAPHYRAAIKFYNELRIANFLIVAPMCIYCIFINNATEEFSSNVIRPSLFHSVVEA
ncbi:hypothetical protein NEAUS06_0985 [Nematocida ausubeli]|nr:hypothetical protein NEAUS06_0985 [Nematocida ausubeli]